MKKILAGHGSGGKLMNELIDDVIRRIFGREDVQPDDSALLEIGTTRLAFTTDTFVVTPIFFPGGDIGTLAVNGTVNDLAVMGARPLYLSCGLVLEEGFSMEEFEKILASMKSEADSAGVKIVTGDTKVVPRGKGDRIYINTSGIGAVKDSPARRKIVPGDAIIISGTVGDHGMTIMSQRNNLTFTGGLQSDCAHLNHMIEAVLEQHGEGVKFMRDATRGGLGSVLNEIVSKRELSAMIQEEDLPVRGEVRSACDILGLDPVYVANEGKVVIIAQKEKAAQIVEVMRKDPKGKDAAVIGEIDTVYPGKAYMKTAIGGKRFLPLLIEEQLPRIC